METTPAFSRRWRVALGAVLAAGVLAWWALQPSATPPELPGPGSVARVPVPAEPAAKPPAETTPVTYYQGMPVRPAGSGDVPHAEGMLPHAITPTHERIYRENALIGNLNGAMDVKDAAGLRELLAQYRDEYPEDAHVLADGYELIANCLEHPGPETRAVAQRYYDEQLDSGLRRYIRRHCLEAPSQ